MSTEPAAPALKEIFNSERLQHIADEMQAVYPAFDSAEFLRRTHQGLDELSLMQRLVRVSESLHAVLPLDYRQSIEVLRQLAPRLNSGFVSISLPHYVASYGGDDFELSMEALKYFTRFRCGTFCSAISSEPWRSCRNGHETPTNTCAASPAKARGHDCRGRSDWRASRRTPTSPPGFSNSSSATTACTCANRWPTTSTTSPRNIPTGYWT